MNYSDVLYSIKEGLGVNSDDRSWKTPDKLIMHEYENTRAFLIHQRVNKSRKVPESWFQTVALTMTLSSAGECGVSSDCEVLRSTQKIPSGIIYRYSGPVIDYIRGTDMFGPQLEIITDSGKLQNLYGGRIKPVNDIFAYIRGEYLYAFSMNPALNVVDKIVVRAVFSHPSAIIEAGLCEGEDCTRYPISPEIHTPAKELVINRLGDLRVKSGRDVENDANPKAEQEL